jgi:hypothetical protein
MSCAALGNTAQPAVDAVVHGFCCSRHSIVQSRGPLEPRTMSASKDGMDKVQLFVQLFYKHIREGTLNYMTYMYEVTFPKITEDFYPDKPWPHPNNLKGLVNDYLFWMLYNVRLW